jgi:hypothetical protein
MRNRAQYLAELELDDNASLDDVRQAYRDLAKVWHPDRFPNDPRMRAKASEKLRRVIEAYEFLKLHPNSAHAHSQSSAGHAESRTHQKASEPSAQRRDEVTASLATLKQRARHLHERVAELRQQGVVPWERRAWLAIGFGLLAPPLLVLVAPGLARALGTALWLLFTGSCVSVFLLTFYRSAKLREETGSEARAVTSADVRCSGCGLGVVGTVSPTTAEQALGRAGWALGHLRCPHCRRAFV